MEWRLRNSHSLVTLSLPLFGKSRCLPPVPRVKSNVNRFKMPGELLRRAALLSVIGEKHDDVVRSNVPASVQDSWVAVKSAVHMELSVPINTDEAMAAAQKNAPQLFWNGLAELEKDSGAPDNVTADCMLLCVQYRW